ncbi:cytochrome P450 71A8-like [Salvia hispanica]|uniref:cytochrome P450 71A8-like n=1 Tax=Salvia hispanica TaxID=49212 RepID=UPI002009857D|nr:cytochrome P450 71A8-like [Salvia hispanica]
MEEIQQNLFIPMALLSLILLLSLTRIFLKSSSNKKLPPSPPKLPIIGNLHQLGSSLPHRDLHSLSQKHGPLMLLHFGSVPVLIVSSAEFAREIMVTHDTTFANRPRFKAMMKLAYRCRDVSLSPYGEYWRRLRSILVLQLLSNKRVQSYSSIREEEAELIVKKVLETSGDAPVNLSAMFQRFSNDVIGRSAFGGKLSDSENGKKFLDAMADLMELLGVIDIGDFIPWLGWIGRVNGVDKRLDNTAKKIDQVMESVIQERMQEKGGKEESREYFVDILLDVYNDKTADACVDRDSLKAIILDVFVGGTDTISTAMEWTMSELLRNPTLMEKLQLEVRGIVKQNQEITDDDLRKMHYLKAVIKEAMRLHPPVPLLVPRLASKDVQVKDFDISAGTIVMINAWAIGRDPVSWGEPETFMPERFLNSSIDFKGLDFELIPFGGGRRGCPGITLASVGMELLLADLVRKFDWKLGKGVEPKDLDMRESPGMTVHRVVPLVALASPAT